MSLLLLLNRPPAGPPVDPPPVTTGVGIDGPLFTAARRPLDPDDDELVVLVALLARPHRRAARLKEAPL